MPALRALAEAGHNIVAVYTQPDRPSGRGRKLTASPIKQTALELGVPVEQPEHLRDAEAADRLARYAPDVMVVAAYGLILPPALLQIPRYGCINIHASLLPRWRGAAPIQRAILAGDAESGVCIMQMEKGLDTGPVFLQRTTRIEDVDTGGTLHDRLAALGADAIVEAIDGIARGVLTALPQDASAATYAQKLDKSEARIDWRQSAELIARQVRAFNPWPVAETRLQAEQLRIWMAYPTNKHVAGAEPGSVIATSAEGIEVSCGSGTLMLQTVQLPGGRAVAAADFLNSHDLSHVHLS